MLDSIVKKEQKENPLYSDLTLFVNSCDGYEDCWIPFFKLLDKYWPECNLPIILNTETKTFDYPKLNIICPVVERRLGKIDWGLRFIESLKFVKTKYILLTIDDFFISSFVNVNTIVSIIEAMKNETAAAVYLGPRENMLRNKTEYEVIEKLLPKQANLFNLQVAIWDKTKLRTYLRHFENPWSTERFGSKRAYWISHDIYCYSVEHYKKFGPIIIYPDTGGIGRGQWVKKVVDEILIPNQIIIDTEKRGYWPGHGVKIKIIPRLIAKARRFPKSLQSYVDLILLWILKSKQNVKI